MAINPNIALGVQPVQQPNLLAQAGQIMALKAAQQEIQGTDELRAAYAQGGDLNDPEFRRRVMAANPKLGSQLVKTAAETSKIQNDAIAKRIELSREMLTGVNTPEDYLAWHESNHRDPVLGGYLGQRGITADQSRAKIMSELSKPGGLEKLKRESALGASKLQQELLATERTRISAGPGYMQAQLAREKFNLDQQRQQTIQNILAGGPAAAPVGGPAAAPVGGPAAAPVGGPTAAPVNALTPTPAAPVNALVSGDTRQQLAAIDEKINSLMLAGPNAMPVVQALVAQKNAIINDEKSRYGETRELQAIDPDTGKPTTYLARFNNLTQQFEPVRMNEPPISVGGAGGPTSSQLNVAKPPQKPTPFQSTLGAEQAKKVVENQQTAQDAASIIQTNQIGRDILNSGAITGAGANFFVGLNQALKTAGIDLGYGDAAANSQAYVALMAQNTAKIIKQFGAGTGLSDADREYAAKAAAGQITLDEKAIRRVLDINDRASRNAINLHNKNVQGIKSDIPLTVEMPKVGSSRVFSPQEQQALEWADANPRDPRAAQIRQRLGL